MYKVFFNKLLIELAHPEELPGKKCVRIRGDENLYKLILTNRRKKSKVLRLVSKDFEQMIRWFRSHFHKVKAAGGVVMNDSDRVLLIHRRGKWDLPKGKLESGEKKKEGAIREVMEETGVDGLQIHGKFGKTYHIFFRNKVPCLKETHWYFMRTSWDGDLIPQTNEDIVKAEWVKISKLSKLKEETYDSLHPLIDELIRLKD
jgi:8-oxo-dGTP pyrophosphatase MutT (NUDIX family)